MLLISKEVTHRKPTLKQKVKKIEFINWNSCFWGIIAVMVQTGKADVVWTNAQVKDILTKAHLCAFFEKIDDSLSE